MVRAKNAAKKTKARKKNAPPAPAEEKAAAQRDAFAALKKILAKHEKHLVVVHDKPGMYYLDTRYVNPKNKKRLFFGAVISKSYVSFHFMPVYMFPELARGISPELRNRMQGKGCFNFRSVDKALFRELEGLIRQGLSSVKEAGMLGM